ncbi:MAG: Histidine kinase protein [Candidatus Poribacteria bacterium]|nr:Histidine kinase protein [Candidatus Poribacteria bacterium]
MNIYTNKKKRHFTETLAFRKAYPFINSFSNMLGVSITLFDTYGNLIYQSSWRHQYCEMMKASIEEMPKDDFTCSGHYAKIIDYVKNYRMPYIQKCHAGLVTLACPLIFQDITQEVFSDELLGILFFSPLKLSEQYNSNDVKRSNISIHESDELLGKQSEDVIGKIKEVSNFEIDQIKDLTHAIFGEIIESSWEISQIVENSVSFQNELTLLFDFAKQAGGKTKQTDILINVQNMLNTNIEPSNLLILLYDEYLKELTSVDDLERKSKNIKVNSISMASGGKFIAEAIRNGKTVINNNLKDDPISRCINGFIAQKGMVCPIKSDETLLGLMVLFDKKNGTDFFADEAKFTEVLASSVGIVFEIIYLTAKLAKSETWKEISFRAAHKIGNVLFALKGPIAQMKLLKGTEKLTDDKISELVKRLDERMAEADSIIRSIKDYIRPSQLNLKHENINSIVEKIIRDMQLTISERISLKSQLDDELPGLLLDVDRISRSIEELIQNATCFIKENGEIFIRTGMASNDEKKNLAVAEDEEFVVIDISDTGTGVVNENKEKIFYPFFSTRAAGTGQGLAIVATDIQLHGGGIKEVGKYGEGAKFLILLPVNIRR